ncbi:MAG: hypothetical protein B6242_06140 [Anaerolineaceae bacterium 4572_78]|nr:MAG: hypothetical protein B6242_06140 [Anaerolineaceae bacterium 4572_78]
MNEEERSRLNAHAIQSQVILIENAKHGEVIHYDNYILGFSGINSYFYNLLIPLNLFGLTDDTLADASAFFTSQGVSYAISLEEHRISDGGEYLTRRRYQSLPPEPILASNNLPNEFIEQTTLTIKKVSTVPGLTAFYMVLKSVYDFFEQDLYKFYPTNQLSSEQISHFVGFVDGNIPVVAATAVYSNNVISIWNTSTLDNFRRKKCAMILLNHILVDAKQKGYDLSLVYARAMGYSLFSNLGYKLFAMRQLFVSQEI